MNGATPMDQESTETGGPGPRPEPGTVLPDVTLPDQDGHPRRLSDLTGGDPLVLHTYRGWFCPKERAYFHRVLLPLQGVAEVGYVRMVSVSVEPPQVTAGFRAGLEARWTFLSDIDRTRQQELGLLEVTDLVHRPYLPTVMVCDPDLTVRAAWNGYWIWGRPSVHDLWSALRASGEALRQDWVAPHA
jgi:peroxiredoxin